MRIIELTTQDVALDFNTARAMAELAATRTAQEVMLVAWFDGKAGKGHPDGRECTGKLGWLAYAESHGGDIRVNINHHEFVFIFASAV
jgi:hypothetical protein